MNTQPDMAAQRLTSRTLILSSANIHQNKISGVQCINPLLAILQQSRTSLSSLSMVNLFQVRCAPPSMVPESMRLLARKQLLPTILAVISSWSPSTKRSAHSFPSGRTENAVKTMSTMKCLPGHHDATVRAACFHCKQPKKECDAGSTGKPRVVAEPHLGAAAIEKLIEERVASGSEAIVHR